MKKSKQQNHSEDVLDERLGIVMNSINEAVIATDVDGYITTFNAAAMDLLDTNVNLKTKKIGDFVKVKDDKGHAVDILDYTREEDRAIVRDDLLLEYPDGEKINVQIHATPIRGRDGYVPSGHSLPVGYVLLMMDITRKKSLDEERDEFISVVSHELRTPIAVAEGSLSNLKLMLDKGVDFDTMKFQLDMTYDQVRYLEQMINDISTLSRAQRGIGSDAETIDVAELAQQISGEYAPMAEEKKLKFKLDLGEGLGEVKTSRLYLHEVLHNFITNSLKYTKAGSVTLSIKKQPAGELRFAVTDTGIGISKSDQEHIFDKFYRSEDYRTRETSGTGLGLYLVAKLTKMLGTRVEVDSDLDKGSTFSFTLPPTKKRRSEA